MIFVFNVYIFIFIYKKWVNCPLTLDIPIAVDSENVMELSEEEDDDNMDIDDQNDNDNGNHRNDNNKRMVKYLLYAAVIHSGRSAEFGHYYAIGRHVKKALKSYHENRATDKWYMFNDRSVSISTYDKLCKVSHMYKTDVPYLLFYKRIDENIPNDDKIVNINDKEKELVMDKQGNNNNQGTEPQLDPVSTIDDENDDEWEKKVEEDNKTFEKELARFASQKSSM